MAVTAVASGIASVTLLAGGTTYSEVIIENSDANRLYVRIGSSAASSSDYSFSLAQYENVRLANINSAIQGIWAADGTGSAHVTAR